MAKSPPKPQQTKLQSDVKRIRVSGPKPGQLYPNLSDIELTETDTEIDTEYTVGETEAETATLDEKTETETEGDYYVQVKIDELLIELLKRLLLLLFHFLNTNIDDI